MKQITIIAVLAGIAALLPLAIGDSPYFIGVLLPVLFATVAKVELF